VIVTGKTIVPTIIDTHVHLGQTRADLERDLARRAYFGVSAAQSLGSDKLDVLAWRKDLAGGGRYFSAGRGITRPEPGRGDVPYWINTEAEGRAAVRGNAAHKVDILKIWVDHPNGQYQKLTPELYGAIIDEAHRHGHRLTAHIFKLDDAKGLVRAGVDAFAHGVRDRDIDDEFLSLMRQNPNIVLTPNLPPRGVKTDVSWLRILPAEQFAAVEKTNADNNEVQTVHGIQSRNLGKLASAGTIVVLGTDGNNPHAPHTELEDMVHAGLTPMQAIVAGTKNGAVFLRMHNAGTLEHGKDADFIVLDANPLDDIRNTRRISAVYLRGAKVDRSAYP
jgi:imidazolonepropionase-like amidohydrolase